VTDGLILVTGGAGFIGSELVRQLAAANHRVAIIDNLTNGKRENLEGLDERQVSLHVEDVRHPERFESLIGAATVVFHLACLGVRHSIHAPLENHDVNATGTLRLLEACRAHGTRRFVYVSSSEVYGTARTVPIGEDHPTYPNTVYGASKLAGECYARAFFETYGYPTVVVRPFNSYGPRSHHEGDSGEVIPKFMLRALAGRPLIIFGDGTQTRDFTFVADTANGIMQAAFTDEAIGRTINLGTGQEVTITALAQRVAQTTAGPVAVEHIESRPGDVLRLCADNALATRVLGWSPRVTLEDGLARLHRWYLSLNTPIDHLLQQERVRNWASETNA
jgi:UDP-glucose 4-epimerase